MFNTIGRSSTTFFHYHLCVEQHEASHGNDANIQVSLYKNQMNNINCQSMDVIEYLYFSPE